MLEYTTQKSLSKRILPSFLAVLLNYLTSYFVFPAIITIIPCYYTIRTHGDYKSSWWILITMTFYLFADCGGRFSANFRICRKYITVKMALCMAIFRLLFIALFLMSTLPLITVVEGVAV